MPTVIVPEALVKYASGKKSLDLNFSDGQSFASILQEKQPQLYQVIFDRFDQLNGYVAIFKNDDQIDITDGNCIFSQSDIVEVVIPMSGG